MKKLYTTLLCAFTLMATNTNAQVQFLPSCNPPAELLAAYDDDIRVLALRYAWQTHHPDTASIQVSPALYDFVADGFAAVYNANLPAADSAFNKYCVHTDYDYYADKQFYIVFNGNYSWTQAWRNGQTVTGNQAVDNIFTTHQLEVDHYVNMSGERAVYIKAAKVINLYALNKALKQIPGINYLEPNPSMYPASMSPNGMIFSAENNIRNLTIYMNFYNTDPAYNGWAGTYFWKFQVYNNCTASDLGSYVGFGEDDAPFPLPAAQNCNLFLTAAETISSPLIQLFPNPTSGTVHIQTQTPLSGIKLYNATGSCVLQQPTGAEMNINHLPTGLYYFSGTDAQGKMHTQRLVKN